MKFLIIFTIFCLLDNCIWAKPSNNEKNIENECLQVHRKSPGFLHELPMSERKIVMKCIYEKLGYLKDNILQKDFILEISRNSDKAIKSKYSLSLCSHIKPNDTNDLAYELNECFENISGDYFTKNWKTISKECNDKVGLSRDEYSMLQYLPVKNITENMKLYPKCILERNGFLKDNSLQEEVILEVAEDFKDAKHLKDFVKECKDIKEDNENVMAFKLYKCMEEIEDKYILRTEDEFKMVQKTCLKEQQLAANDVFTEETPSKPTTALKKFADCVFDKMGYVKNGALQVPVIFQKAQQAKYPDNYLIYLSRCVNSTENNYEDLEMGAYNFGLCLKLFSGEHFLQEWQIAGSECEDSYEVINDDEYPKMKPENPTDAMKYYAACVFKKLNFLRDNNLQENVILQTLADYRDAEYLKSFLNSCKHIKENQHSDTAFRLFVCMEKVINEYKKI